MTAMLLALVAGAVYADPAPVPATDTASATSGTEEPLGEVVVTARKQNERLIDVPVAVVAFTAESIEKQAIYSLADLAEQTPGLSFDGTISGSGRNDRSFPEYIIRGMTPSVTANPTTSVFIDGAPFVSGQVGGLDDLERIEVLEGPQTAYFGRQTFAGAINLVTRDPANTLGGSISALGGSDNYYDVRGSVEGPIIPDYLTARASVRYYTRSGTWENEAAPDAKAPGDLGAQQTRSGTFEIVAHPNADLKIKALYMYWQDRDGAGAQGLVTGENLTNVGGTPIGGVGPNQSNCTTRGGFAWFCGVAPSLAPGNPSVNNLFDAGIRNLVSIADHGAPGTPAALFPDIPDRYGLNRNADHWSVNIDYHIEPLALTVTSLTAADVDTYGELQDLADRDTSSVPYPYPFPVAGEQPFFDFPFWVEGKTRDFSQELRITSDQDRAFHYTFGGNYAWTRTDSDLGGLAFALNFGASANTYNVAGVFYGLSYDFTRQFNLSFEGRFQRSEEAAMGTGANFANTKEAFNDFTPRVIAQFKFTPDIMGYATYSTGINPGTFNSQSLTPYQQQYVASHFATTFNSSVVVSPEKLKNYELGLKGKFLENTLTATADIYYDIWSNQITSSSFLIPLGTGESAGAPQLVANYANDGTSHLDGVELKLDWTPISHLDVDLAAAVNASKIVSGTYGTPATVVYNTTAPTLAQQVFNGNQLPNSSKYQLNLGVQYGGAIPADPNWNWYGRVDESFKSKEYVDQSNLVSTPNIHFVNLRAGVTYENTKIELFCDNVANFSGATSLAVTTNLTNPTTTLGPQNSLVEALPYLRTYGVRVSYKFGSSAGAH
jgi:iron complex outermembrane receptor protein